MLLSNQDDVDTGDFNLFHFMLLCHVVITYQDIFSTDIYDE